MAEKRDYSEEIENSKFAWQIFRQILIQDKPYTTKIAEELDTEPQSVSNYIKGLRDRGLVKKKEKRGRVQIYEADLEGLYQYWLELEGGGTEEELISGIAEIAPEEVIDPLSANVRDFVVSVLCYEIIHQKYSGAVNRDNTVNLFWGDLPAELSRNWKSDPEWLKWFYIYLQIGGYNPDMNVVETMSVPLEIAEKGLNDSEIIDKIKERRD